MRTFFVEHGYPTHLLYSAIQKAFNNSRRGTLKPPLAKITDDQIPLVLTFHPFNYKVRDVISHRADKSGDLSPFHSIVYVHPPPTYSLSASASFTDRL